MGYIFRLAIPPRFQNINSFAALETKLGQAANTIKNWEQFPDYWQIELADNITLTSNQKTALKTAINSLYSPDVP